jgi:hypothetical protein
MEFKSTFKGLICRAKKVNLRDLSTDDTRILKGIGKKRNMRALRGFTWFKTAITSELPNFPAILYTSLKDLIPATHFAHPRLN